jgi:hypothetical protein
MFVQRCHEHFEVQIGVNIIRKWKALHQLVQVLTKTLVLSLNLEMHVPDLNQLMHDTIENVRRHLTLLLIDKIRR